MSEIIVNARFLCERATGVGRLAMEVAKKLKALYPSIKFVAHKGIYYTELAAQLEVETFGVLKRMPWEQIELPSYLIRKHKNAILLNLANSAPLLYTKNVVCIADVLWKRNPEWYSKKSLYYFNFLIPRIVKRSLKVLTISEFSKSEICTLFKVPPDKVQVFSCAVSEDFIRLEGDYKYSELNERYILSVSSIDPRKNLIRLIEAYRKLELYKKGIKLYLVGQRYKAFPDINFELSLEELKYIIFTGYVSDEELVALYKNACIFVYPTLGEGFGLPPLEAMSKGCPVITSKITSLPDVCGDAAYYIDPHSIESIAEGISTLIESESLRKDFSARGLEQVKRFSWELAAQHIYELIKGA